MIRESILKPQKYISPNSKKYKIARREVKHLIRVAQWERRHMGIYSTVSKRLLQEHREFHLNYPNNFLRESKDS